MIEQNRKRSRGVVLLPNQTVSPSEKKDFEEKIETKVETKVQEQIKIVKKELAPKPIIKNEIIVPKVEVKKETKVETKVETKPETKQKSGTIFSKLFSGAPKKDEKKTTEIKKDQVVTTTPQKSFKLLLLGSGESGKSTLFKQIKGLYEKEEYSEEENYNNLLAIYSNVLHDIRRLCIFCLQQEVPFEKEENNSIAKEIIRFTEAIDHTGLRNLEDYTVQIHEKVKTLWKDANLLDRFIKYRYELQLYDGAL